jgi:hypothetical protein
MINNILNTLKIIMKTSNKILLSTIILAIICFVLLKYSNNYVYQKAFESKTKIVDLNMVKFLKIQHGGNLNFIESDKFQMKYLFDEKSILKYDYVSDTLIIKNLVPSDITFFCPKLPNLYFENNRTSFNNQEMGGQYYGYTYGQNNPNQLEMNDPNLIVYFGKTLNAEMINATFKNSCNLIVDNCNVKNLNLKSQSQIKIDINNCTIQDLSIDLPNHSIVNLIYSKINNKKLALGDSSSINITGQQLQTALLK